MNANGAHPNREAEESQCDASLDATLSQVGSDVRRLLDSTRRVFYIESQRLHLFAVETFFRAAFYICLLGFGLTASISASLFIVRGVRSALLAWSGAEWVGELGSGVVVLALIVGSGLAVKANLSGDIVRRAKRKLIPKSSKRPTLAEEIAP